jgi:hypothetical protein
MSGSALVDDILVSDKDLFSLTAYYKKEGGKFIVVPGYGNPHVGDDMDGMKAVTIDFHLPDWSASRNVVRNNTIFVNNSQSIDYVSLRQSLFEMMAVSWNIVDVDGNPVVLDTDSLGKTRPDIMRCFLDMLERKLVEEGLYPSIINS